MNDKPNSAVLTSCSCRHVFSVWPEKLRLTAGCSRELYLCTGASQACQVNWVESGDKIWLEDFCLSRILNKQRCSKSDVRCEFIDMTVAACSSDHLRENINLPYLLQNETKLEHYMLPVGFAVLFSMDRNSDLDVLAGLLEYNFVYLGYFNFRSPP